MAIKDLPLLDRPREKALNYGVKSLSDNELLAILIQSGTKNKTAIELSIELICFYKGLNGVFDSSLYELCKINGISKVKALQILAVKELFLRYSRNNLVDIQSNLKMSCALDVYNYLHYKIESLLQEQLVVLYLNVKNIIIYEEIISIGNDTMSVNNNKLICKNAIEKYAKKVIICHNHPSGNSSPSLEDITTYFSLKSALKYLQINLLDHIIIGKNEYYSIANESKYQLSK